MYKEIGKAEEIIKSNIILEELNNKNNKINIEGGRKMARLIQCVPNFSEGKDKKNNRKKK